MIKALVQFFRTGYTYIGKHPQLIMTLVLLIVIPLAFIVSGQQFLQAGRENQERLEQARIGLLHDIFVTFIVAVSFEPDTVQQEIENIASQNPDITDFHVAREDEGGIRIIASLKADEIDTFVQDDEPYGLGGVRKDTSFLQAYASDGVRYWRGYREIDTPSATFHIFTQTSLAHIDTLFAERIRTAYYWLFGLLAVILLLIVRHIRMIDYAYLYSEVKRANHTKDLFTNMIAHELRAPLSAMRGYASMIREAHGISDEVRKHAVQIEDAAERLVVIVSDLLDVARIQSGKLEIVKEKMNVQDVVHAVIEAMQVQAKEKNIELKQEGIHGDFMIHGDKKRLHQALTNLVSNAIKYTPSGSISLSLAEVGHGIEIRVKDTGMGISAENQKNLFAPFFRVSRKEVEQITGTGLGMFITKQLIELMGGSIGIESIKGVGTHVVVVLQK